MLLPHWLGSHLTHFAAAFSRIPLLPELPKNVKTSNVGRAMQMQAEVLHSGDDPVLEGSCFASFTLHGTCLPDSGSNEEKQDFCISYTCRTWGETYPTAFPAVAFGLLLECSTQQGLCRLGQECHYSRANLVTNQNKNLPSDYK